MDFWAQKVFGAFEKRAPDRRQVHCSRALFSVRLIYESNADLTMKLQAIFKK